nr:hypothetical protein [Tanacetum cinerariifolium]
YLQRYEPLELLHNKAADVGVSGMYRNALQDNFYAIRRNALDHLRAYRGSSPTAVRSEIQHFASADPSSAVRAQAITTLASGTIEQYSWFLRRLPDVTDIDLYTYLQSFGSFMVRMPVIERERGVKALEALARTHPQYFVRLGAYRGLLTLVPSTPALKETLRDIREKEKDERLKTYYGLM